YKIPVIAWQYIIARIQNEFPETIFLLEGLGGSWEATENLLTDGGMQWAYSELFQNYSGRDVANYLDYSTRQSARIGGYFHYSETHDNSRLAEKGRAWSLMRNRLCALTSPSGGFGFTCGVEWLAAEKIRVHGNTGLNWGSADNIVPELAQLNKLISDHPCFFDGAKLTRLSVPDSPIYALLRESAEGKDSVLVLVNTDVEKSHLLTLAPADLKFEISDFQFDLLGQPLSQFDREKTEIIFTLAPGACHCLAPTRTPVGLSGENYRRARAQAAFAIQALSKIVSTETLDGLDWQWLAEQVDLSPENFLAAASEFAARETKPPFADLLRETEAGKIFPRVVTWTLIDARRVTLVPPGHWLLIEDSAPFRAELRSQNESAATIHVQSIAAGNRHIACFAPRDSAAEAELFLERYAVASQKISAAIRFLPAEPQFPTPNSNLPSPADLVLLTNGLGGMARICVDLGRVNSKYDCVLGANLNPSVPVDRHVFVKRIRAWVNANGFLSPLDFKNLASFDAGPPAVWNFVANAGDGRTVEIELRTEMIEGKNTTFLQFSRPTAKCAHGKQLPDDADVRLTVRLDIEDRNFHSETKRNGGADFHFSSNTHTLDNKIGFAFTPVSDRQLHVFASSGEYHPQPEWCENIPHPVEQTRGQTASGDAYSPGWFELPLPKGGNVELVITADRLIPTAIEIKSGRCKTEN
ncbi:MAG TPA: glycogen debranching enzyme N-terminal domain-containing protein, partial [Verrucomicrobiae bacterium]|nr:glycogen debranching enzyme N-terminal domain-containing protein [Verrucomicrobiae bacterium]